MLPPGIKGLITAGFISLSAFAVAISIISMSRLVFTLIQRLHHKLREACIPFDLGSQKTVVNKSLVTLEIKNQRTERKILKLLEGKNETVRYLDIVNASTADQKFQNPTNVECIGVPKICSPMSSCRSSRSQMFFKIRVLRYFVIFTGKHLCCLKACNFIKKRLLKGCFPVNIAKFLRTAFFIEHFQWLLLKIND